jgi:hypothetical protein
MTEIDRLGLLDPLVRQYGLIAVPVIATLESLGAPLPSESLPILAAVMAEHGSISFPLAEAMTAWAWPQGLSTLSPWHIGWSLFLPLAFAGNVVAAMLAWIIVAEVLR